MMDAKRNFLKEKSFSNQISGKKSVFNLTHFNSNFQQPKKGVDLVVFETKFQENSLHPEVISCNEKQRFSNFSALKFGFNFEL